MKQIDVVLSELYQDASEAILGEPEIAAHRNSRDVAATLAYFMVYVDNLTFEQYGNELQARLVGIDATSQQKATAQ
ncbi:hypothetical protein [Grimontia marina]|uniref:Uncharacterized protein n=1 Tax=Grimontia marina TaxID=646534 RepID=A0A128FEA8_9GAMM|nr:hypothetical protein [Grimontia marina]CZF84825.1 hypothetical protein GMA8713_03265 [Grimontia marina]